jgi:hypothetical protein
VNPRERAQKALREGVAVRDIQPVPTAPPTAPPAPAAAAPGAPPATPPPASPPGGRRPPYGPKDFISVASPQRLHLAGPETQAEQISRVTTAESVKSGEWAKHREQILSRLGGPPQISSSGTVYAAGLEPAPASAQAQQPQAPQGSIQQPHGHAMTGPIPPLLAAKYQAMRERKRALKAVGK